ncbi:MAG: hypothetical protein HY727_14155 [Candidatus Rokubacteria bacterium]|nr:hypothetical protein [Candidatus Rokubacteria bacterium]
MNGYALGLARDRFERGARYAPPLSALNRVLYVLAGELAVTDGGRHARVATDGAGHGSGQGEAVAGPDGATVLRWELATPSRARIGRGGGAGIVTEILLEHPIDLDPAEQYLMRADRVDFAPGGVALPHRHKGGGIRCLIAGTLEVRVGDEPPRLVGPGQAWFESGREPVRAAASADHPTSFIRVAILPRAIKGMSSIVYVDPDDAARGKPRKYTVYVDEPIEIG